MIQPADATFRVVSWNLCKTPFRKAQEYLSELRPDIAILQEVGKPEILLPLPALNHLPHAHGQERTLGRGSLS